MVNGTAAPEWKYVLDVQGPYAIGPWDYNEGSQAYKIPPIIGPDNENITCGRAAFLAAPKTETADIVTGTEVVSKCRPMAIETEMAISTRGLTAK
jgi:hypothetical protein